MPEITIDPKFLDLDLISEAAKHGFGAGNLGQGGPLAFAAEKFGDVMPLVPRNQWQAQCAQLDAGKLSLEWMVTRIYNQGQEGSCVANACSQAHEIMQAVQFGKSNVIHLSAISLYKRIGRSPNSGSYVSDGLEEMRDRGVVPLDTPENRQKFPVVMPNTGFYERWPAAWEATAKLFRADEWWEIDTIDELVSAQLLGYPVVVGRAGHSICYVRPFYKAGRLYNLYANSWGQWGQQGGDFSFGFGVDSESYINNSSRWAFALRSIVVPEQKKQEGNQQ